MRETKSVIVAVVAVLVIVPLLLRPVTVIEVTAVSGAGVEVHGWTQASESAPREKMEPRATPFSVVLKGAEAQAQFVSEAGGAQLEVRAKYRRGWIPLARVRGVGATVSLDASPPSIHVSPG